ncbi:MAG: hypothetical protein B6226_00520 [Candidatus Cloacimonetes bacterium 4572_65]|nr:MAG: hypothetical protein B6226_00520 [Candidatus Cloacimonetes bacterium 4572_65]
MKKIIILALNARYTHSNLALFYLRNSIEELSYNIELLQYSINMSKTRILGNLVTKAPDILAISVYIWNKPLVEHLLTAIKQILPTTKIVLGGPEAGYNSSYWLSLPYQPDYIIKGAGERAFRTLALNDFSSENQVISLPTKHFQYSTFPYRSEDLDELSNHYIYYESSRGCPFKCSFCLSSRTDQYLEYKNIEDIKDDLTKILAHNPKIVKFVDRSFNANRKIAREVWKFINSLNVETIFHFEIHPAILEEIDFSILESTPKERIQFEIGIQSTNPKTLQETNRNFTFDKIKSNISKLIKLKNIHIHLDLIAGLPYEDKDSFLNSLNDLLLLTPDVIQLGFLKVLPGTLMYDKRDEYQIIYDSEVPYQIFQNKWLSFNDMQYLLLLEDTFEVYYNSERFKTTFEELISEFNNPVDLFKSFLNHISPDTDYFLMNWKDRFYIIYDYLTTILPDNQKDFITDCLTWDWINHSRKDNQPPFLTNPQSRIFRNRIFDELKTEKKDKWHQLLGEESKNLKKCSYFHPLSERFKRDFLEGDEYILIFKEKHVTLAKAIFDD